MAPPGPEQGLETDVMRRRVRAALLGSDLEGPRRLGRYDLLGSLGHGGMGVVYRARDGELDRIVALKVLRDDRARDDERLRREARALAKLSHPNIVAVLEVGLEDDAVFVAMEYVHGGTLGEWCLDHPLGERGRFERALDLALQSLRGLAAAHDAGLVHCDLKPSNMLVGRDGRLRIADFGLARESAAGSAFDTHDPDAREAREAADEGSRRQQQTDQRHATSRDTVAGTPLYMAPEQFQGRATPSSDIFSWCVSFHEVFFGIRPFAAKTAAGLQEDVAARRFVSPPRSARAPDWLRPILLRGLDVDPQRRWPDVASILRAIESRRRPRKWPWVVGSTAAFAATVLVARVPLVPQPVIAPCTDDRARLDAVWGPDTREAIHANLDRVAVAYGPATWERVEGRMEELATRWRTDRLEACRQGREHDPELAAIGRKRTACLDRSLDAFAFVAETLTDTEQNIAPYAVPLLLSLGYTVGCGIDDLERASDEVDGEAVAAFDRAMLLDEARRGPEAIAALEALAARLPRSSRLRARTWAALADAHANLGPGSGAAALEAAHEALAAAEAAGDSVLLVNAWRTLARAQTLHGDFEDASFAIERARNLATRPEVDDLERARIEAAHAILLERKGDFVAAADHYRRAIDWHRKMRPGTMELAFLLVDASGPLLMAAAPEEATDAIAQGVTLCETLVGPAHPETALALVRSAQIGVQIGRDDVLQELERAAEILRANPQFHPEALVDVRMTQADLLRRAQRYDKALVAIDEAIAVL